MDHAQEPCGAVQAAGLGYCAHAALLPRPRLPSQFIKGAHGSVEIAISTRNITFVFRRDRRRRCFVSLPLCSWLAVPLSQPKDLPCPGILPFSSFLLSLSLSPSLPLCPPSLRYVFVVSLSAVFRFPPRNATSCACTVQPPVFGRYSVCEPICGRGWQWTQSYGIKLDSIDSKSYREFRVSKTYTTTNNPPSCDS